jgi:ATP-dependent DNA helicase PIF1
MTLLHVFLQIHFPSEFLNTLDPQGLPPHILKLKVGMPIIMLRNLNPRLGLMNGTRLIVLEMRPRLIKAKIVTGSHRDQEVLIPRIPLTPSDSTLPIKFTRLQFPVRPAFAMTINKAQGQTFEKVGIYLPQPVFSHGQLYVAMSRVGQRSGVRFLIRGGDGTTLNVVYDEIFH